MAYSNEQNKRLDFPMWFRILRGWLPLSVALTLATTATLALIGYVAVPSNFGMLQWAPVFFASLQGFAAVCVGSLVFATIASTLYFTMQFITKGLAYDVVERIALEGKGRCRELERKLMRQKEKKNDSNERHHQELISFEAQIEEAKRDFYCLQTKYQMLLGNEVDSSDIDLGSEPKNKVVILDRSRNTANSDDAQLNQSLDNHRVSKRRERRAVSK